MLELYNKRSDNKLKFQSFDKQSKSSPIEEFRNDVEGGVVFVQILSSKTLAVPEEKPPELTDGSINLVTMPKYLFQ